MASSASNVDVELRRSGRKRRADWQETLIMKIRASRASGSSEKVSVSSLGGQPSHKKERKEKNRKADVRRMPFCGQCGHKHVSDDVKFCSNCGTKREDSQSPPAASQLSSAASQSSSAASQSSPSADPDQVVVMRVGRKRNVLTKLRCGWHIADDEFIAPDGTSFTSRKEASVYHNKNVPKLEPARQDGWKVFVDETDTHTHWICPDGQVLNSFVAAKSYAAKSQHPIWGKDGLTKTLSSYFGKKQDFVVDLTTRTPTAQSSVTTIPKLPARHQTQEKKSSSNDFNIPRQTNAGLDLQQLLRKVTLARDRRKQSKAKELEKQYHTLYTFPMLRSNNMHNRVRHVL